MDETEHDRDSHQPITAPDQDIFLEEIARLANIGIGQWITLSVSGIIISGRTLSGPEYFTRVANQMEQSEFKGTTGDVDFAKAIAGNYRDYIRIYDKPEDAGEDWAPPKPGYLHLEMAKIITPSGIMPSNEGLLWRGRLGSIDGFSLSRLG